MKRNAASCIFALLQLIRTAALVLMTFLYIIYLNVRLYRFVSIALNDFLLRRIAILQKNTVRI